MAFIKTTNIIREEETKGTIRMVECPYCRSGLKHVPAYITAMKCWHCGKEFRIQQDSEKTESIGKKPLGRTVLRGVIE